MTEHLQTVRGWYEFLDGKLVPRGDMELINERLREMKILAGSTETGAGEFYFDAKAQVYWHYVQHEDYRTELRPVSRAFIEANFPGVNCNRMLDVPWERKSP